MRRRNRQEVYVLKDNGLLLAITYKKGGMILDYDYSFESWDAIDAVSFFDFPDKWECLGDL
jgi:hypothetical protein